VLQDGPQVLKNLIDDTEISDWQAAATQAADGSYSVDGKRVTIDLAGTKPQTIRHVQVSALLGPVFDPGAQPRPADQAQNRFTALAILMVPYATILIPLYVVLGHLGLQDSLVGLSLVLIMFQLPFAVFMMRNAFEALPRELEESALVDGCTTFAALRKILLHGVRPALITVGLFAFLASWNDFFAPLILLSDGAKFTLPVAVVSIQEHTFGAIDYGALEAGVMVMAVPCVALFLGLQRHYVQGFTTGALRG
jgi:ABC-type maltose transport system permease subunit